MKFDPNHLFGIYQLNKIETRQHGRLTDQTANAGMFVFGRDYKLSVVNGAMDWVMAYTGNFEIEEDSVVIHIQACIVREMENTTIKRKILHLDEKNLVLDATGTDKTKTTEITWVKTLAL